MVTDWDLRRFGSYKGPPLKEMNLEFYESLLMKKTHIEEVAIRFIDEVFPECSVYREVPAFGRYVFDFFVPSYDLIIEVDGRQHRLTKKYDKKRDRFCRKNGLKVLRLKSSNIRFWKKTLFLTKNKLQNV